MDPSFDDLEDFKKLFGKSDAVDLAQKTQYKDNKDI